MVIRLVDEKVIAEIDRFVEAELDGRGHPGSSLSLIKDGEVVYASGYGYMDVDEEKLATAETVYRCASVTKPVVTTGFLQLWEKGLFRLDDAVSDHLDVEIKDINGGEPSIRDLLTHRSGMPTRVPPIFLLEEEPLTMKGHLEEAARCVRPRGEKWAYCNTGFMMVGYLIEHFKGQPYDDYLTEKVLEPLGMESSSFTLTEKVRTRLAQGYKRAGGVDNPLIPVEPYYIGTKPEDPAGSMYSTVLDLGKFVAMNLSGGAYKSKRILEEETLKEMQRLQSPSGESSSGMGLTWFYMVHDGHVMLNHTGGLPDFTNNVCFYPEESVGVCWLSNLRDGSGWRPPSPTVLRLMLGEKPRVDAGSFQSVPWNWDKITGEYGDELSKSVIRVVNGFLTMDGKLLLERKSDSVYHVHGPSHDGEELTFEYDSDGYVKQFCLGVMEMPRYEPFEVDVDTGLELTGNWGGEYYDSYGFHDVVLQIISDSKGTIQIDDEEIKVEDLKAENGLVEGKFVYHIPEIYARWGTVDQVEMNIELRATEEHLKGVLRKTMGGAMSVELDKI
ncbi:serine hydrolase [Candidatus Bathyarchaeota archaeon]|nr:serine hydrolase [Candidatus Bathyarchaeota archaeon]